jgi:hypothetical protein
MSDDLYEERAAILQYDAGMSREAAEALAREQLRKQLELFNANHGHQGQNSGRVRRG